MNSGFIVVIVLALAIAGGAFYVFTKKKAAVAAALAVPPFSEWTVAFSVNMPGKLPQDANGFYFDVPAAPGEVHYIATIAPAVKLGQTVKMTFSTVGTGKIVPTSASGSGPAAVRLLLWRKGDNMGAEFYRYWSVASAVVTDAGDYEISQVVDPARWSDVAGKLGTASPADFSAAVSDLAMIGFTFGAEFAGHGVFANGPVRFILKSYTVQ